MNDTYKAAVYCRLSKDDEQNGDSVSIETQKMMLTKYCNDQMIDIFDIYVDDGYSGLNFNRPSFKRLIQDLEDGKFNVVITKDLSRLGRDYIQTGYYIDIYFTSKKVRYIAVNDGIDTKYENNDIAPFKNILNDMYAKDISKKIKSAKMQRAQNGLFISAQAPYGYKIDPFNRNKLIIDEAVAPTVKRIFQLATEGNNFSEISRILEIEKHISPSVHKAINGDTRFLRYIESQDQLYKWSYQTVRRILKDLVYVGDMVNHKFEVTNYKTKERVRVPPQEQIVVPNTHEAIIDRDIFNKINGEMLKLRKPNHKHENIFKGMIFCLECGTEMQLICTERNNGVKYQFRCPCHASDKSICTHNHSIYYGDILEDVKTRLVFAVEEYIKTDGYHTLCQSILKEIQHQAMQRRKSDLQCQLVTINKEIREFYRNQNGTAKNKHNVFEMNDLIKQQSLLINKIREATLNNQIIPNNCLTNDNLHQEIKELIFKIIMDPTLFNRFIERIEIGHREKTPNGIKQKIVIQYKF